MKNVKGSILLPWVKAIRSNKTGAYDNLFSEEERKVIFGRISQFIWYPYEVYQNCVNAVAKVEAKGNVHTCKDWGRTYSIAIMSSVYEPTIKKGNPSRSLDTFVFAFKSMFNFCDMKTDFVTDTEVVILLKGFDGASEFLPHIFLGWIQGFLELCVGNSVRSELMKVPPAEKPLMKMRFFLPASS